MVVFPVPGGPYKSRFGKLLVVRIFWNNLRFMDPRTILLKFDGRYFSIQGMDPERLCDDIGTLGATRYMRIDKTRLYGISHRPDTQESAGGEAEGASQGGGRSGSYPRERRSEPATIGGERSDATIARAGGARQGTAAFEGDSQDSRTEADAIVASPRTSGQAAASGEELLCGNGLKVWGGDILIFSCAMSVVSDTQERAGARLRANAPRKIASTSPRLSGEGALCQNLSAPPANRGEGCANVPGEHNPASSPTVECAGAGKTPPISHEGLVKGRGDSLETLDKKVAKKRGRKPKGGKLVLAKPVDVEEVFVVSNIILHLKCFLEDLVRYDKENGVIDVDGTVYTPSISPELKAFETISSCSLSLYAFNSPLEAAQSGDINAYRELSSNYSPINGGGIACAQCAENSFPNPTLEARCVSKLSKLKTQLCRGALPNKKSACFWCTCEFDGVECYIPTYDMNDVVYGYGSFCRPECASAFLMKEGIDDSSKFERYHLLNRIYGKAFGITTNIKPAPDPHYLLDKFYGSLSIQEYRKMLQSDYMLITVEKPMTRVIPEMHEDSNEFTTNLYGGRTTDRKLSVESSSDAIMYRVMRSDDKPTGPTKAMIIKDRFG